MRTRYIPAGIMLLAGAVTCIVSILQKQDIIRSLITLLVVLILFYIIGLVAKFFIEKILKDMKENGNISEENNDSIDSDTVSEEKASDVEISPDKDDRNRL